MKAYKESQAVQQRAHQPQHFCPWHLRHLSREFRGLRRIIAKKKKMSSKNQGIETSARLRIRRCDVGIEKVYQMSLCNAETQQGGKLTFYPGIIRLAKPCNPWAVTVTLLDKLSF